MAYKMQVLRCLSGRMARLRAQARHVVFVGDFNISPAPIDHCDPSPQFGQRSDRRWLRSLLSEAHTWHAAAPFSGDAASPAQFDAAPSGTQAVPHAHATPCAICEHLSEVSQQHASLAGQPQLPCGGFVDTFRAFHAERSQAYTCWNTASGARANNWGTRIDLILVADPGSCAQCGRRYSASAAAARDCAACAHSAWRWADAMAAADVQSERIGSDHAPAWLEVDCSKMAPCTPPSANAAPLPESSSALLTAHGKQASLATLWKGRSDAGPSSTSQPGAQSDGGAQSSQVSSQASAPALHPLSQRHSQERHLPPQRAVLAQRTAGKGTKQKVHASKAGAPVKQARLLGFVHKGASAAGPPSAPDAAPSVAASQLQHPVAAAAPPAQPAQPAQGSTMQVATQPAACTPHPSQSPPAVAAASPAAPLAQQHASANASDSVGTGDTAPQSFLNSSLDAKGAGAQGGQRLSAHQQNHQHFTASQPDIEAELALAESASAGVLAPVDSANGAASSTEASKASKQSAAQQWRAIQSKYAPIRCSGHNEECVMRQLMQVKKAGPNNGRLFYVCARNDGAPPQGRCDFFQWVKLGQRKVVADRRPP